MPDKAEFIYELQPSHDAVRSHIQNCEGRHVQQAVYSTFMGTLTQICFTCQKIRGTIDWDGNRSWPQFAGPWIPSPEEISQTRSDMDVTLTVTPRFGDPLEQLQEMFRREPINPELEGCGA